MTHQEIIEDFFAYSVDSPDAPESTERYWEKALLDDKDYVIPSDNVCGYIRRLLKIPYGEYLIYVRQNLSKEPIESKNITQCSSFVACERDLCKIFLEQNNPGLSYEEIGRFLKNQMGSDREEAFKKYGENQVKTAKQLGLAFEYYGDWYLSILGYVYLSLSPEEQRSLIARTLLRDRLYATILSDLAVSDIDLLTYMDCITAESTKARRYGCVEFLVNMCLEECSREGINCGKIKQRRSFQKKNDEWIATHYNQYAPIAVPYNDNLPINIARRSHIRIPQEGTRSDKYLHLISSVPPLKTTEERELICRYQNGDKAALDAICESYLPTLYNLACQFNDKYPFVDVQDLVGEGVIALCTAIFSYKLSYENRIITYAVGGIKQRMRACVFAHYSMIHLPLASQALFEKEEKVVSALIQDNEREPRIDEIAEMMDLPINALEFIQKYSNYKIVGYDDVPNDIISKYSNAPDKFLLVESINTEISRALATLTPREADILRESFGIGTNEKELIEIANELHLTRERVRQIQVKALKKLESGLRSHILQTYLGGEYDYNPMTESELVEYQQYREHVRRQETVDDGRGLNAKEHEEFEKNKAALLLKKIALDKQQTQAAEIFKQKEFIKKLKEERENEKRNSVGLSENKEKQVEKSSITSMPKKIKKAAHKEIVVIPNNYFPLIHEYSELFIKMNRIATDEKLVASKAILMLAILSLYANDEKVPTNMFITPLLRERFEQYWKWYVKTPIGNSNLETTWEKMKEEPFWHQCYDRDKGCYMDSDLRMILKNVEVRKQLREVLKSIIQ